MLPDIGNAAMNAPGCWQLRDYAGTSANTLAALQIEWGNSAQLLKKPTKVPPISKADEFHSRVGNSFLNCQQMYEATRNL